MADVDWGKVGTDLLYKFADAKLNKYQRPQTEVIPRGGAAYAASQGWRPPMLLPPAAPSYAAPAPVDVVSPVVGARGAKPMWQNPMVLAGGALALVLLLMLVRK